jgi:tetratricopeptide (TPR) repeat protein
LLAAADTKETFQNMMKRIIYVAFLCGLGLVVWRQWPRDAEYYYNRGEERLWAQDEDSESDIDGALADFNRAIRLNPAFAAAYERRAYLRSMFDLDGAVADYNRALELEPKNPLFYVSRSNFEESHDHLDAAMADLNRAIELSPKDSMLYDRRSRLKYKQGNISGWMADRERACEVFARDETLAKDYEKASDPTVSANLLRRLLRSYDRAIGQNTNFAWGYYHRAVLKHLANDLDGALADLHRCSSFSDSLLNDYAALQTWLIRSQKGKPTEADAELAAHFLGREDRGASDWETQIARFLLGQISQEELSAMVGGTDTERRRSQVWYYSAMKQLLAGDKTNAAENFRKARFTETRPYAVEISAQIQLSILAQ